MINDAQYSQEELNSIVVRMQRVANSVYLLLQSCNVHAFIEFNGLMQKYVDLCRRAAAEGVDFTMFNTHTGTSFEVRDHDVEYMAEKFDCIFGPLFRKYPELWILFKEKLELP
jgi:hypothetical protein